MGTMEIIKPAAKAATFAAISTFAFAMIVTLIDLRVFSLGLYYWAFGAIMYVVGALASIEGGFRFFGLYSLFYALVFLFMCGALYVITDVVPLLSM